MDLLPPCRHGESAYSVVDATETDGFQCVGSSCPPQLGSTSLGSGVYG